MNQPSEPDPSQAGSGHADRDETGLKPRPSASGPPDADHLRARIGDERAGVRRIAVADLERAGAADPTAPPMILETALHDPDEKARILAIRALARLNYHPACPDLLALYEERSTPAAVAHAAILAHDTIKASAPARRGPSG